MERTLAWLSKCRAILVCYDKKASNYMGLVQLACALLLYRRQRHLTSLDTLLTRIHRWTRMDGVRAVEGG